MVDSIGSGLDLSGLGLAPPQAAKKDELGQEEFLNLMVTQLKNQDPFKPLESGEFLGQLAQFGTVSGLAELQDVVQRARGLARVESSAAGRVARRPQRAGRELAAPLDKDGAPISGAVDLPDVGQRGPDSRSATRRVRSCASSSSARRRPASRASPGTAAGRRRRCARRAPTGSPRAIRSGNEIAAADTLVTAPVDSVVFGAAGIHGSSTRIGRAAVQRSARDPQRVTTTFGSRSSPIGSR